MIIYKNLDFLGYPNYKVDIDTGDIFRLRFNHCKLNESQLLDMQDKYEKGQCNQKELSIIFQIKQPTVCRILKQMKQNYWIKMKPFLNNKKYPLITLTNLYGNKTFLVSRLICEIFNGPCPQGMECCHNDGNKLNYNPNNVRWDFPKNNAKDKIKHGTNNIGERNYQAKLKQEDIPIIKKLYHFCTRQEIANIFKVTRSCIDAIIDEYNWRHI